MQLEIGKCSECEKERPIVNKKYKLCTDCNFKRTHGGRSQQVVYSERAKQRAEGKPKETNERIQKFSLESIKGVTKASKLKSISADKKYRCSDGTLVSQIDIKIKYDQTKFKILQDREPVCQGGINGFPLSISHTISRQRCKDLGKTELIWDPDNCEIEGYHEPSSKPIAAHNIWESGTIEQKIQLLNFERKLDYIEKHDPEQYRKLVIKLEEIL